MSEQRPEDEADDARLASLVRFGFPEDSMVAFLDEHEGGRSERLGWLEDRRQTATDLHERIEDISPYVSLADQPTLNSYLERLEEPFSIEEAYLDFDRYMRTLASWEPHMNRAKPRWFEAGDGDLWLSIFERLGELDVSSHAALAPLHRLLASPERVEEVMRHLGVVEDDERRQLDMIEAGAKHLREIGYPVENLAGRSLLEALQNLESWQAFHAEREHIRLEAVQLIGPFDKALATDYEQRCHAVQDLNRYDDLEAIGREVHDLAQALEQRRRDLSDAVQTWRNLGIVFPHQGDVHPNDLMEWEANHDSVANLVEAHLDVVEKWKRFAKHWPARIEASRNLVGHLDRTEELRDLVDEMDGLWKQLELDGLDLLQSYENAGLSVGPWRQRVVDNPMSAMEQITAERERWDVRIQLMEALDELDVSFEGEEDVLLRRELLRSEDVEVELLEEMQRFVLQMQRRNERHRVMLEEEVASMRRSGVLERESATSEMSLRELEHHVGELTRSNGADRGSNNDVAASRILGPLMRELNALQRAGWLVKPWLDEAKTDPLRIARALSEARPHLNHHDALRRRLSALPWQRDVALGLEVEMLCRQPHRLDHLAQQIPSFTAHLAQRPVEDEAYVLQLWQPSVERPTLVPRPEQPERFVLQPASALEEAHEAMLEAMDLTDEEMLDDAVVESEPQDTSPLATTESADHTSPIEEEEVESTPVETKQSTPPTPAEEEVSVVVEAPAAPVRSVPSSDLVSEASTEKALKALAELTALLGMGGLAETINAQGLAGLTDVRRGLASHVNVAPRDVRIGRMLRLMLRLLPAGDNHDETRAALLAEMSEMIPALKRWMRRRLEARHSGAKGDFLSDAVELGVALQRIPGLGQRVPLEKDEWPLPTDIVGLTSEVQNLSKSVHLPSAGGVKA